MEETGNRNLYSSSEFQSLQSLLVFFFLLLLLALCQPNAVRTSGFSHESQVSAETSDGEASSPPNSAVAIVQTFKQVFPASEAKQKTHLSSSPSFYLQRLCRNRKCRPFRTFVIVIVIIITPSVFRPSDCPHLVSTGTAAASFRSRRGSGSGSFRSHISFWTLTGEESAPFRTSVCLAPVRDTPCFCADVSSPFSLTKRP